MTLPLRHAGVGADAILELDDGDRKETAYAMRTVYLLWEHLPLDEVTADYQAY